MTLNIALLSRGVFVFGIVGHSCRTKRYCLLSPVALKHGVVFLFWPVGFADRLEAEGHLLSIVLKTTELQRVNG